MTQQTKIEWTDFTVNFWEGCQKVGPGCDHCYAEARNQRFHGDNWGPGKPRRYVKGGIAKLHKINRGAEKFHEENGHWPRVFCSSLSDIFDNAVDKAWRLEAFSALEQATDTRPQLLTKRVGNVFQMIPQSWAMHWPRHIGLMITVVNQAEADRDIPKLLDLKAKLGISWVGLSMEPLLGPVRLDRIVSPKNWGENYDGWTFDCLTTGDYYTLFGEGPSLSGDGPWRDVAIDWVIVGGESGHHARPTHPDWIRSLRDQCEASGTPFLFKQWGEFAPFDPAGNETDRAVFKIGKKAAGRLLDGRTWDGVPT
ncbi:MAG TPA: phage Gp37/Gp68 family protein [Roseobacter sp.]|uniref:Phage Gp37Gp68 family protein n=1 Tax=marine sediment metagenome TaxID=412755 RepID=A0A0F9VVH1_9ZZZZ|nr:phage Gp37/Gp68 family protein [Roseobacter sp.]